jgi:SAM-dependent methyltransferase
VSVIPEESAMADDNPALFKSTHAGARPYAGCLYRRRSSCRLCTREELTKVFSLAPTPLANAFVREDAVHREQHLYPLDVFFCDGCGHLQLLDVVDPVALYEHYVYVSGTSPVFVRHFRDYANYVIDNFRPPAAGLVVDIASNDGTLLRFFKDAGHPILGVDPAREIASRAMASGIPTLVEFFSPELAGRIRREHGSASVVTANNVIAHVDDLESFMVGVRELLADDGVFVFEVSNLADVVENTLFDMIYHEHLDYHSVKPLMEFFARCGMELIEAICVESHGGSLRGVVQRKGGPRRIGASVAHALAREQELRLDRAETFQKFAAHIESIKLELVGLLRRLKSEGRSIAGFGAPAKTTTLMYHFGIEREMIDFIVDDSPLKQGHYTPGMHIPVVPAAHMYQHRPDYLLILAWNFAEPIMAKQAAFRDGGGRFIIPLPKIMVV